MSVNVEPSGRRSVQVEFEVPGTPEDVWHALATGPGISSWFVPTEVEERDGNPVAVKYFFGPGMEIPSVVTASDKPVMFAQEAAGWTPDSPAMATEWRIEARSGGTCIVRIVHSLCSSTDAWDNQLEGAASGWSGFLGILRLYLKHFSGQRSALMQVTTPIASTEAEAWDTLTTALGVKGLGVGQRWATPAGVSPLSGVVELVTENPYDALLRLDTPGPGIAALGAVTYPHGARVVAMNLYVYGAQAAETVASATPVWQAFLEEHFPMPAEPVASE
ncbi:MAG: SRPBCC domain-containing protein [Gemmatimonadaceae bacterium]|nr:SRPBCC domain-containing protein [Gemmatimonadaceae bacterium]